MAADIYCMLWCDDGIVDRQYAGSGYAVGAVCAVHYRTQEVFCDTEIYYLYASGHSDDACIRTVCKGIFCDIYLSEMRNYAVN